MTDRPTSQWVDLHRCVAHPKNPNRMSSEEFEKLRANVGPSGELPPLIVRTLELTQEFDDLREADQFQIIDGEHRWKLAKERGDHTIEVRVWTGISDGRAEKLLATLNRIHGTDDKKMRASLVSGLAELETDHELLATILPESAEEIAKIVEEVGRAAVADATEKARAISQQSPLTIFVLPEHREVIRRAITLGANELTADAAGGECQEGAALAAVCHSYLAANVGA